MKNNINLKTICGLAVLAVLAITACTGNYDKYNTMPYRPPRVDPPQLLTPMIRNIVSTHENDSQMIDQMIGMEYGGYTSVSTVWGGAGAFATYNPRQGWLGSMYGTLFTKTYGNWAIIYKSTEGKGAIFHLAQIVRVATMLKTTDTYGPIPYTQIDGYNVSVVYDRQEDIYLAMIDDLNAAVDAIQSYLGSGGDQYLIADYDASSYNGNLALWIKYANSLKLRMAIRMSGTGQADYAKTVAEAAVAHQGGLIESNSDNLYILPESKNPYYISGVEWGELRANASLVSYMNGYGDPRREAYFTTGSSGSYVGLRSGMASPSGGDTYKNTFSQIMLKDGTSTAVIAMTAAEVAFLRAEGALIGWNMGDTVEALYNQGITVSFDQHGASGASAYLADSSSTPGAHSDPVSSSMNANAVSTVTVKWDDAAGADVKLERIMIQKWIAMYPLGFEAWSDIRRTGYPKLFQVVDNLSDNVISTERGMRRVPFSRDEFNTNEINVTNAVTLLGGEDTGATDLWWAKKN